MSAWGDPSVWGAPLWWAAAGCAAATAHSAFTARFAPRPLPEVTAPLDEPVSVLVPARNAAHRIGPCLESVRAQRGVPLLEVLVLDEGSDDDTAATARAVAAGDPRVRLHRGAPPPPGRPGRPQARRRLADHAHPASRTLVFLDPDVVLASPHALASLVTALREHRAGLLAPHLTRTAHGVRERLVRPLTPWCRFSFLPLWMTRRPERAAAEGRLLVFDRSAYEAAGGHGAVRREALEDRALAREVRRRGGRLVTADATRLARCGTYASWSEIAQSHTKSLRTAMPFPLALCALMGLCFLYVVPPAAACAGSLPGLLGYALAVAGRWVTGRAVGHRTWPDALAHPLSVLLLCALVLRSYALERRESRTGKGRSARVPAPRARRGVRDRTRARPRTRERLRAWLPGPRRVPENGRGEQREGERREMADGDW
ncbi:glycosyltransferase [Streptomyces sp. ODS28]|uniref:glycosyltransferase n=1 Tax=Streptomyces sp. ODS28 TaxID=3136688 RepID=UPI0031E78449